MTTCVESRQWSLHLNSYSSAGLSFTKHTVRPQAADGETQAEILDGMALGTVPGMELIQQIFLHE